MYFDQIFVPKNMSSFFVKSRGFLEKVFLALSFRGSSLLKAAKRYFVFYIRARTTRDELSKLAI